MLAREQISRRLALRWPDAEPPRVWTWDDAWRLTAISQPDPPARLSSSALLTVLDEAIERGRRLDELDLLADAVEMPGYRRQLLARFDGWTRAETPLDGPKPDGTPVGLAEFALFGHYRATLYDLGAEDAEGWAVWMSKALVRRPPVELQSLGQVFIIEPIAPSLAAWRLIDFCRKKARSLVVTLPFDPDPALIEQYAAVEPTRKRFLDVGFVEETEPEGGFRFRPSGLDAIERELFRGDASTRPRISLRSEPGLKIIGGPKGDGVALLVAREVAKFLERGVDPEEILILAPRLDDDAERVVGTLTAWGLPADRGMSRLLANVPAISALRLAMRLPADGWDAARLARLLRNGQVRWKLDELSPFARFEVASSIHLTRVFRDREALLGALRRASSDPKSRNPRAGLALQFLEPFTSAVDAIAGRGTWRFQVERLRRLAELLEIDPDELEPLWDALEDQAGVLDGLRPLIAEREWSWSAFAGRVDSTASAIAIPRPDPEPGTIRIEAVSDVEGARARVVILINLAERTFPAAGAIDLDALGDQASPAYAREILRFARVSGSADESLVLAYSTSDQNGETLLPAGFLDDLIRRLDGDDAAGCLEKHNRFDPALIGHEDLAKAPADARVRAVALACRDEGLDRLDQLASQPEHAEALRGAANAFVVAHFRTRPETGFGPYDGWLEDTRAIDAIRARFGPDHTFSPSQLESFALCPFQFAQRYVFGLKVVDERQELDEDYAGRGDDVHRVLEQIHITARDEGASHLIDRLNVLIDTQMRVDLEQHDDRAGGVAAILKEIGTRRTNKALARYVGQFQKYADKFGANATPNRFEVVFGQPIATDEDPGSVPELAIGEGESRLLLQGKIDRIDLIPSEGSAKGKPTFRVIDYKTGSNPSGKDVNNGLASQLPLYALAVERLIFPEGNHALADFGYWSLKNEGFKPIKVKPDWETYRESLIAFVLALVKHLRQGAFPIESQKPDCRKRCDFQAVCRIGEVRRSGKRWPDRPSLEDGR